MCHLAVTSALQHELCRSFGSLILITMWGHAGPALDLTFLLNEVMENVKPLNWDAVIKSPIPLKVKQAV